MKVVMDLTIEIDAEELEEDINVGDMQSMKIPKATMSVIDEDGNELFMDDAREEILKRIKGLFTEEA